MSIATVGRSRAVSTEAAIAVAAVAAAVAGAIGLANDAAQGEATTLGALNLMRALAFVAAGLVAWRHPRAAWAGTLMVATGFCLFVGTLTQTDASLPFTIGAAVGAVPFAVLAHLVLA